MNIICIMGRSASGKSTVENTLEQMGFTRSISYTTREPQIRNGVLEEDGREYRFTDREKFMKLVDSGKIIEYEEYNGNLYGTPRPFGGKRFVATVCVGGYKALKELYGDQVLGIYLKVNDETVEKRSKKRDNNLNTVNQRRNKDIELTNQMELCADIIIDGNQDINKMMYDILKELRSREENK